MSEEAEAAVVSGEPIVLSQRGQLNAFFRLSLRNGLLNLVTLTLYRFWGKTAVRRLLWSTTYLNEEPLLPNVDTYRLDEPGVLDEVLPQLDSLVLKPVDGAGGAGIVIGSQASEGELLAVREKVLENPRGWIAQREVKLSMVPTLIGNRLRGRHVDLRPFAVNDGDKIWVLPGGLTRVALPEGALVVNSSQGGGSKDTWVLAAEDDVVPFEVPHLPAEPAPLAAAASPDVGPGVLGAEEQQQQQQQGRTGPAQAPSAQNQRRE